VHDATVIVADTLETENLLPATVRSSWLTTGEKRPARWVRNLVAVRVLTAE
jgi:hypothetical protein